MRYCSGQEVKRNAAENGAKALFLGEFKEVFEYDDKDFYVPISWDSIKTIYKHILNIIKNC